VTSALYDRNTNDLLYYLYNKPSSRLDIYSLTAKKYLKSIALKKGGMTSFGDLQAIFCNTPDSIFLMDNSFIGLIDSTGAVEKRWPINERGAKTQPFFEKYEFYTQLPSIFYYDRSTRCMYVQCFDRKEFSPQYGFKSRESFGSSGFIAKFDPGAKRADVLPVSYPAEYTVDYYGNMLQPSVDFIHPGQGGIAYIFPISPAIFTQDANRDTVYEYNCSSSLTDNAAKPLSWADMDNEDLKVRHFHKNVNFFRLLYTDNPAYFYRFHYDKMDSTDNDFQNVYARKKLLLTVLDKNFGICKELSLPFRNIRPIIAFTANGTVFVPMVDPQKIRRTFLQFLTIKIDKK
jgi:hypothetical protein